MSMELNEYQAKAMSTCTSTSHNILYMLFNLQAEVGEFSGKIAKELRKGNMMVEHDGQVGYHKFTTTINDELKKEAGDILWQLSGLCKVMGWEFEDVATSNLEKLASRKQRGVIVGEGDNR